MRITEQTPHCDPGMKGGEGVCIDQRTRFASSWPPAIMQNFGSPARDIGFWEYCGLRVMESRLLSTVNHEDSIFISCTKRRVVDTSESRGRTPIRQRRLAEEFPIHTVTSGE